MLVRDYERRFAGLITATSEALSLDPVLVEKDYWAVEALRAVHDGFDVEIDGELVHIQPIFKGGTSLSKAFALIERFSEDVDLLVPVPFNPPDGYGQNKRNRVLKACTGAVRTALSIDGERSAGRKGVALHWRYPYASIAGDPRFSGIAPMIRVEATVMGGPNPSSRRSVTSMVAEHARTIGGFPDYEDLAMLEIETLGAERTLVEKLAMLHDAAHQALGGDDKRLAGAGRHFYDVARILGAPEILSELGSGRVESIAADSDAWSDRGGYPFTPRPPAGYATSPAFTDTNLAEIVGASFQLAMDWVWSDMKPSLDECIATVHEQSALL